MNHIYRVVWNDSKRVWQAVTELGRAKGKSSGGTVDHRQQHALNDFASGNSHRTWPPSRLRLQICGAWAVALGSGLLASATAANLPTGGQVVAGSGSISQSGAAMTITQGSNNMVVNWDSFSVGAGNSVNFVQPGAQAAALNRVLGSDVSVIQGAINANGRIFLVNPNGVLFSPTAQVNVGSLVASTLNISTEDFMRGNYRFEGTSSNAIINQGNIKAVGDGNGAGTIALIAAKITNLGTLTANKGNVLMGAGQKVRLDLGGPVKLEVEQAAVDALIEQGGAIKADGGLVYLTAKAAGNLAATVINHTGVTEAQTLQTGENGQIYLLGDMQNDRINVGGTLDASAPKGGDGGFIETSAAKVVAVEGRKVTTKAPKGKTGTYLIDPNDFTIAANGGNITGTQLSADLDGTSVTISTAVQGTAGGNGDIFVNDAVSWNAASKLTLNAERNISINADITAQNANGQVALHYGQGSDAAGNTATYTITSGAKVNLQAGQNFSTKLGEDGSEVNWTVITSLGSQGSTTGSDLQGINGNLSGRFVLGADIDASSTSGWNSGAGFVPLGNSTTKFTGSFDGLGHTINGLYINRTANYNGLFGYVDNPSTTISNVGVTAASVSGLDRNGILAGWIVNGKVVNSYSTGSVAGRYQVGGLVGFVGTAASFSTGSIISSYSLASVYGSYSSSVDLGGLVGLNFDFAITDSFATGAVNASSSSSNHTGGLVGRMGGQASIADSFASGSVSGYNVVGGLVGYNYSSGTISRTYASGQVTGIYEVGGLIGTSTGLVSSSYWNINTTGQTVSAGGVGIGNAEMSAPTSFADWNISSSGTDNTKWRIYEGLSAPLLRRFLTKVSINGELAEIPATKVYDGLSALDESLANVTWVKNGSAFVPDSALLSGNLFELSGKNVGVQTLKQGYYSSSPIGYDITYNITGQAQTITITPKALSISGTSVASKVYDGTIDASATVGSLSGLVGDETLDVSVASALFASKNAGEQTATVAYTLADGSYGENQTALASNYTLDTTTHTATINQKALAINGTSVADKTYDGTTEASATVGSLSGLVGDETLDVSVASALFASKNAGEQTATVAYTLADGSYGENQTALASNYMLDTTTHTATINQKALVINGTSVADKVYDGTIDATATIGTLSGFVGEETISLDQVTAQFASKNVGENYGIVSYTLADGENGGLASNYSLVNTVDTNAAITAKALSINGTSVADRTYDGTTDATATAGTLSGLVGDETLDVSVASALFASKNAGEQTATVAYTLADGSYGENQTALASNYTLDTTTHTATINQKALSITGTSVADKTYDGTTEATATAGSLSGLVGDETLDVSVASALFAGKNAGEQTATVAYTLADGSYGENQTALASNYTLDTTTHTATINQKALSITGTSVADKTYDGTTEATATAGSLSGLVGDETLDVSVASALFASKNAGEQTATVAYTLADGSYGENQTALASNYTLDTTTHTATINQKALSITGTSVAHKTYDGTTDATATAGTLSGLVGDETLDVSVASALFASKNAGEQTATVAYTLADGSYGENQTALASNYTLGESTHTATINQKALNITGTSVADKTYDGTTEATATAGSLSGLVGDETLDVSVASALFANKNAGEQTATVAYTLADGSYGENQTALASNYTLDTTTHTATINQKALSITGTSVADKTYDGTTEATATAGSLSGLVGDETLDVSVASALFASKNAGEQTATVAYTLADGSYGENQTALASNYTLDTTTHTATINQKALSITGTSVAHKTYDGTTDATATAGTLSGLVGDETLDVSVASALFANKNAGEQTATVAYTLADGSYGENQTALASNYTLGESTHTATINQKALNITGTSVADKTYDGTTEATATAGSLSGLVGDETLDVSVASALFANKNAGEQTATVAYTLADGSYGENQTALASNYTLDTTTHTATINQKALSITGTSVADKTYDGTTDATATAGTLSGLVGDETLDVSVASALFANKNAGEQTATVAYTLADGSYGENQTALASNYTLDTTTHTATINQRALAINGTSVADKTYDGTTEATATAGTLSGLVGDETLDVSVASALFANKNAGEQTATVAYTLADGSYGENQTALASNYTLDTTTHTATINQKALAINGTSVADKTYDGTTDATATAGTLSGLVGDETLDVSVASALFASKNAGEQTATVAYTLADGSYGENQTALASNYTLDTTTHTATINQKALSITGTSVAHKTYDGTTDATATAGTLSGLVGDETLDVSVASALFASKNAGEQTATVAYTLADGSYGENQTALASNYSLGETTHTATINQKALNITGTSVADKTYDGTTDATATAGTLSGLVGDETLDVSVASALFAGKNAGEQTATVAYTLADGSYGENQTALASNYTLDTTTHTATITPRTLTITGSSVTDKVYDGTTNADITSGQLNNLVAGETLELAASGAFGNRNAGTYAVNINYTLNDGVNGLASNYSVSPMTTVSAQITPRPITVSADDKTKIHLQPDPALTWSLTEGRLIAGDSLNIPLSRNAGETVGIYPIFAQSIDNPNYQVSTLPGRFTIVMSQTPSNDIIIPQRAAISSANSNASGTGQSNGNGLTAAGGNPPNFAGNSMAPQQTGTSGGAGNSNSGNSLASGGLIFVPVEAGSSPASTPGLQPILVVSSGVNLPTESIDTGFNSSAISGAGAGGGLIP